MHEYAREYYCPLKDERNIYSNPLTSPNNVLDGEVEELQIEAIIGFDGAVISGLKVHPDGEHIVFPIGNKVAIQNWCTKKQHFLTGHTNIISALDVSTTGNYVASGQINHIGFRAWVIIWDFYKHVILSKHEVHKVRIESVKFSIDDRYVTSLGGRDCGNIVVWDVQAGAPLSGTEATSGSKGEASSLRTCNRRGACFITAGDTNLTVWGIDVVARSISGVHVNMSRLRRIILCLDINERDEICYCGTSTGDVLKIRLNFHHDAEVLMPIKQPVMQGCFTKISKKKLPAGKADLYEQGIRSLYLLSNGLIVIGSGCGIIDLVEETKRQICKKHDEAGLKILSNPVLNVLKTSDVKSSVTSLQIFKEDTIFAGTVNCEIYAIDLETFATALKVTCHSSTIYCVAFPYDFSEVFATGSKDDIRIWDVATHQELLRIKVPNFSCSSLEFAHDGKSLVTAWNDGVIRAFTPLSGRLMYAILNAHNKGASALAVTHNGRYIVSGGCEGQVRIWEIFPERQSLLAKLTAHNGPISEIHINKNDDEAVSASTDGSCIIWDLVRQTRKQVLFANTLFMCVRYYPDPVQILTGGADRKLGYWEVFDGNLVREIEGSPSGAINSLDISNDGILFVTGGNDQIVKIWLYQEGITTHIGIGHSAVISSVRFSPNRRIIVSTSASGSIFFWKNPYWKETQEPPPKGDRDGKICPKIASPKCDEKIQDLPSARSNKKCPCP